MNSYRKTAITVGALFIIATVTAILTIAFLGSTLDTPLSHTTVSKNEYQIGLVVLLDNSCHISYRNWFYDVSTT
jgi:hypothetical protein